MPRSRSPIPTRSGRTEFLKINAARGGWRDSYHWVLSLTWPQFSLFLLVSYVVINLVFAVLYLIGGNAIAEMTPGSFPQAFFFSVETLATVGYGHNYPANVYGHVIVTIEIFLGMIWLAVITGLIFVRFSRPTARILFSKNILIGNHNGRLNVMLRVANLRHTSMVNAHFRLMLSRDEPVAEGEVIRRFHQLKVYPEYMQIDVSVCVRDELGNQRVHHLLRITPVRITRKNAVRIHIIDRANKRCSISKRRHIQHRHQNDGPADFPRIERIA